MTSTVWPVSSSNFCDHVFGRIAAPGQQAQRVGAGRIGQAEKASAKNAVFIDFTLILMTYPFLGNDSPVPSVTQ